MRTKLLSTALGAMLSTNISAATVEELNERNARAALGLVTTEEKIANRTALHQKHLEGFAKMEAAYKESVASRCVNPNTAVCKLAIRGMETNKLETEKNRIRFQKTYEDDIKALTSQGKMSVYQVGDGTVQCQEAGIMVPCPEEEVVKAKQDYIAQTEPKYKECLTMAHQDTCDQTYKRGAYSVK